MDKKEIHELKARYNTEKLRDVYVEGEMDKRFYDRVIDKFNVPDVVIYSIQCVEIPKEIVEKHGLNHVRMRDRVLALLLELQGVKNPPKGFVDWDYGKYTEERLPPGIEHTDLANMEMYILNKEYLSDLIEKFGVRLNVTSALRALNSLFVLRFVSCMRDVGQSIGCIDKYLDLTDGEVSLDIDGLILSSFTRKRGLMHPTQIKSKMAEVVREVPSLIDDGFFDGHDAIRLLMIAFNRKELYRFNQEDGLRIWLINLDLRFAGVDRPNITKVFGRE